MPANEKEVLQDIRHYVQVSALALVTIARQIRDGETGEPSQMEIERCADFLRQVSASLPRVFDE